MKKLRKNRYLIYFVASWLAARMKLTFELSRLAFFRINPEAEVRFLVRRHRFLQHSDWIWDDEKISIIKFDNEREKIIVLQFPAVLKN